MPTGTRNGTGKYHKNTAGKYDCPVQGCTHRGAKGFNTPQGVGAHLRQEHGGKAAAMGTPREPADVRPANAHPNRIAGLLGESDAAPRQEPAESERLMQHAATTNANAVDAAVAILKLPELRGLKAAQVEGVFANVKSLMALDEQAEPSKPAGV